MQIKIQRRLEKTAATKKFATIVTNTKAESLNNTLPG